MKQYLIAIFVSFLASGPLLAYDTARDEEVSAGGWHSCVLADDTVSCWGADEYGQSRVPQLLHPVQVSAGGQHTCALDETGVKCWGWNRYGQTDVPKKLSHPTQIVSGESHACAIDEGKVRCWGSNEFGQTNAPDASGAIEVTAGMRHSCAVYGDGVRCWGDDSQGQLEVPPLRHPRQISAGDSYTCALSDDGARCWGETVFHERDVPELVHPLQISAGAHHVCALHEGGARCWAYDRYGQAAAKGLVNPVRVSAGGYHSCAIDDEGVKCWGSNRYHQLDAPTGLIGSIFSFDLYRLERSLERIARYSYHYRGNFYKKLAATISKFPIERGTPLDEQLPAAFSRLLVLNALDPILSDSDSEFFKTFVSTNYAKSVARWNEKLGVKSLGEIPLKGPAYHSTLLLARFALEACRDFTGDRAVQSDLETVLASLGAIQARAETGPVTGGLVKETAELLGERRRALLDRLTREKRTQGFGVLLETLGTVLAKAGVYYQ